MLISLILSIVVSFVLFLYASFVCCLLLVVLCILLVYVGTTPPFLATFFIHDFVVYQKKKKKEKKFENLCEEGLESPFSNSTPLTIFVRGEGLDPWAKGDLLWNLLAAWDLLVPAVPSVFLISPFQPCSISLNKT